MAKVAKQEGIVPPLKWVGGKRKYLSKIIPAIMSPRPDLYVEPFLGAGVVALALPPTIHKRLSDTNPVLMDVWRCIRRMPRGVVERLMRYEQAHGNAEEGYYEARAALNKMINVKRDLWLDRAALALYINARCFNGIWRTNAEGQFNVPFGKRKAPTTLTMDHALQCAAFLQNGVMSQWTALDTYDFREAFEKLSAIQGRQISIYADPPYDETFDQYAAGGFDADDQRDLATWLKWFADRGARVVANNLDTPLIREIYSWAKIEPMEERHIVGSTGARRGKRACVLITNGGS